MIDVDETEVQIVNRFAALLSQRRANRLHVIEAFDRVAGEAAVVGDQFLPGILQLVVERHAGPLFVRLGPCHRSSQELRDQGVHDGFVDRR